LLKNRLYNQAIHKFHINDAKNPDTISNNGNIGLDDPESAFSDKDHQIAVKIINSNQEIMHHTMIPISIFPKISQPDDCSGLSVNSDLKSAMFI
jgi:hypothetical protein